MTLKKNVLIVACGSGFGAALSHKFDENLYNVYGISSTVQTEQILQVDWNTCSIDQFERFLRNLPEIDCVIFNQNSKSITDRMYNLGSMSIIDVWKQSKQWTQSHYVNCIMPVHTLHTLVSTNKLKNNARVAWMLSRSMINNSGPGDYVGQKYQNYATLQNFAKNNQQTFIGVCPGKLDQTQYEYKSQKLINLLMSDKLDNGQFYVFDQQIQNFKLFTE